MKQEICDALNKHLILEFKAWHEYAAMALWFERNDLPGFAGFFKRQRDEELGHAHRILDHLIGRDQKAELPTIEAPKDEFDSPKDALEHFLKAEQDVTASIKKLYKLAEKHEDQPARILLEWFINEQVEEEGLARAVLGRLRHAGNSGAGLLIVDQELGRGTVPGAPTGE